MSQTWISKSHSAVAFCGWNKSLAWLWLWPTSQQGTLRACLLTLLGPHFTFLWPCSSCSEWGPWEDTAYAGLLTVPVIICSVFSWNIRHSSAGKRVPWALLRGGPRGAGFTYSSFLLLQLSLPPMFLALILRGGPRDQLAASALFSADSQWSWALCLWSPCHLASCRALLAFFSRHSWSLGPQNSPTPQGSTGKLCAAFPPSISCRFTVTSVPDCRLRAVDCPGPWGGLSVGISCKASGNGGTSRTQVMSSSWRNGDVRTWLGGISIGTPGRRIMGTGFPRVRWVQDYLW